MYIPIGEKRKFLFWLMKTIPFEQPEAYWLLGYLLDHKLLLENVHLVENVEYTPRGLKLASTDTQPVEFFTRDNVTTDSVAIFHELKTNWQKPLYLECIFPNANQSLSYLSILEANPYNPKKTAINTKEQLYLDRSLAKLAMKEQQKTLYQAIDEALVDDNEQDFYQLSQVLRQLDAQIKKWDNQELNL